MEHRSSSEGSLCSSVTDDTEGKSNHDLLEEVTNEYSKYLNFDVSKEQGRFTESIESMLTKLDEFCGLVDMIRSDTTLCLTKTMPEIQARCHEMQEMFDRIDRLEAFVAVVRKDVNAMEECVSKAENELSSGTLIKKLSSLVSSKKPSSRPTQKPQFTPPPIFRTQRYLDSSAHTASNSSVTDPSAVSPSTTSAAASAAAAEVPIPPEVDADKAEPVAS